MDYVIQKAELSKEVVIFFRRINFFANKKNKISLSGCIFHVCLTGILLCSYADAEGLSYGRFLLTPQLTLEEEYSDNVFEKTEDTKSDSSTIISPVLSGYYAIGEDNRLGAHYNGEFSFYSTYDNLNRTDNKGAIDWWMRMPAGSTFSLGANVLDSTIQPDEEYLPEDPDREESKEKPYLLKSAFAEANLKPGEFTEVGFKYTFTSRKFDESDYEEDDYDRHLFILDYVNRYFPRFPFLLEYRYSTNDRYDPDQDSTYNAIYVGARWTPETRLSGNLRVGYQQTDYEGIQDVDSFVVDTTLSYKLTDMTTADLIVNRKLVDSETVENETGNNYTFMTWGGRLRYRYSEALDFSLLLRYLDKSYDNGRNDEIYNTRFTLNYELNRWVAFSMGYRYTQRDSTEEGREYKVNSGIAGVTLSM